METTKFGAATSGMSGSSVGVVKLLITTMIAFAALLGFASPALAQTATFAITTQTSGNCVGKFTYLASTSPEHPGKVGISIRRGELVAGLPGISGACAVDVTLAWRNADSGATDKHVDRLDVGPGCDIEVCTAYWLTTGPGRVVLELSSPRQHTPGKAEVVVS